MQGCGDANHRYFVADVILIPSEGRVVMAALCTACGDPQFHEKVVSKPHTVLDSLKTQKKNKE